MAQKRREPRYMCAELVNIVIRDQDQTVQETKANLEDISPSGACIQMEKAVRVGADIEIVCAKCKLRGKVRNCRYAETGYDVGVAFDQPSAWDVRRYKPAHLLPVETGLAELERQTDAGE